MCHTVAVKADSRFDPHYGPAFGCKRFSAFVSTITLSITVKESWRYDRISAFVLAGLGPPMPHRAGGFLATICFAQASLAQATCFTCSPNVRTSLNSPCVGLKLHRSSGIASARAVKSFSMSFQMKLIESGMVLSCGWRCCAKAVSELANSTPVSKAPKRFLISPPIYFATGTTIECNREFCRLRRSACLTLRYTLCEDSSHPRWPLRQLCAVFARAPPSVCRSDHRCDGECPEYRSRELCAMTQIMTLSFGYLTEPAFAPVMF